MASLELHNVRKAYGDTLVLDDVSLAMDECEFVAFLGPSGSGKSTLLRIIAGLETLDSGEVVLEGRRIDRLHPGDRDVAMVFQHYALYAHMRVRENMAFPDARHIRLNTPRARAIVELFRALNAEGLTTRNQDFPAATASFMNGEGGIFPTGTWMIGPYDQKAAQPGRPLYQAYAVMPFPRLWGHEAAFVDGHAWVVPRAERTPAERQAIIRFLRFLAAHNFDWTRTGHLPAFAAVLALPEFRSLPHRTDIAAMAATGAQLPDYVQRQSAIQGLIGEELEAAVAGIKLVDEAFADAERRVNELLAEML